MSIDRDAPAKVPDRKRTILVHGDLYRSRVPCEMLIHRVVDYFPYAVM